MILETDSRINKKMKKCDDDDDELAEIVEGKLFLGSIRHGEDLERLRQMGITHLLNVTQQPTPPKVRAAVREVLDMPLVDCSDAEAAMLAAFDPSSGFIEAAIGEGGACLVFCLMGASRSPAIVTAYLMRSRGMRAAEALELVRQRRPATDPNHGFLRGLATWESS